MKNILNFKQASEYLQMSKSYLYKLTSKKEIPHYKPGGKKIYFKREELDEWVIQGKVHTNSEVETQFVDFLANSKNQRKC